MCCFGSIPEQRQNLKKMVIQMRRKIVDMEIEEFGINIKFETGETQWLPKE
jgi:hypothetical protein